MRNFLFIIICNSLAVVLYGQVPAGQLPTYLTSGPTLTDNVCIHEVTLGTFTNNSGCTGATPAAWPAANGLPASSVNMYSNYTSATWAMPLITPGAAAAITVKVGTDAASTNGWAHGLSVFIDYNRNGTFELPAERVGNTTTTLVTPANCAGTTNTTYNFTVPNNIVVGQTLLRVVASGFENTPAPTGTYNWGETEDYKIFQGIRKWDYSMTAMLGPDSISFCAQQPVMLKAKVSNVENQPIPGGRVDLFVKSATPGGTTSLYFNKSFTQSVASGASIEIDFPPVLFPKDELLEFKYVITHPLDSIPSNDTLVKLVQVYKNPVYKLKADTVCADALNTLIIYDKPLPLFHKWANEDILDTTMLKPITSGMVQINVTRGWKCNVIDSVYVKVKPMPILTMARDTVLCNGQFAVLNVSMNMSGSLNWNGKTSTQNTVNTAGYYYATGIVDQCRTVDSTKVTVVNPPNQPKITDTVCAGENAKIGLDYVGTDFIYKWTGRSETTPLINPVPTITSGSEKYHVQWWYQGCTSRDSVILKVNPLPNVTVSTPTPSICPYFTSTITASGAQTYTWTGGLGMGNSKTIRPLTTSEYFVKGVDQNGCFKQIRHVQYVYPLPNMTVYSNKKKDNVCLGDSATIYVNGGKTYDWSTGSKDSIIRVIPTTSFQWTMIGIDGNGCKDTLSYRMQVKPAFSVNYDKTLKGCEGDIVKLTASGVGVKEYDWGNGPTTDNFKDVMLVNSTSYRVSALSPEECEIVFSIPVTVFKKPVGILSDLTICKGSTGILEAKGGVKYNWEINGQTSVTGTSQTTTYTGSAADVVSVQVENEAGCLDTAWTSVNVINTDDIEVVFKSPLDSYNCASPKIPITLFATPAGGVWSGTNVTDNKMSPAGLSGNYQVMYAFYEPVNNCKVERIKTVKFKCTSGINDMENYDDWSVYPMPFTNQLNIKYNSVKSEVAEVRIYDLSGREVYQFTQKILPGENVVALNGLQLAKGTYYLDFQTETISRQAKMLAQ